MKVLEIALLVASASTLQADILYNNTTNASSGVDCLSNSSTNTGCQTGPVSNGHFYDSFTSGAVAERLSDLKLVIDADPTSSGILDIGLYSDSSTSPGALVTTLGTVADSSLTTSLTIHDVALTANPLLQPDTRYWIGLSGVTTAGWSWTSSTSGTGVSGEFFANGGGVLSNSHGPYQMEVQAQTTVPEPSGVLLLSTALVAVATLLRRRLRSL